MVTSTSSSLASLACYLPLTTSSPATAFIHLCSAPAALHGAEVEELGESGAAPYSGEH